MEYFIVDVFCLPESNKNSGNQLGVFIIPEDKQLTTEAQHQIAKEINFAESTFIDQNETKNDEYRVRIFSPAIEVNFAGHPTLGTSFVIKRVIKKDIKEYSLIKLNLNVGIIEVMLPYESKQPELNYFEMTQIQPTFYNTEFVNLNSLSNILGIKTEDFDDKYLPELISTGLPYLVVKLKTLKSVQNVNIDQKLYKEFIDSEDQLQNLLPFITAFYIFSEETAEKENDLHARMFCLEDDIIEEDAATGSAAGCLEAYLLKNFNQNINMKVEQGFEKGRPSLIQIRGEKIEENYIIRVGGLVKERASGIWKI